MAARRTACCRKCFFRFFEAGFDLAAARVRIVRHVVSPGLLPGHARSCALPPNESDQTPCLRR